jgi:hypothetical protein
MNRESLPACTYRTPGALALDAHCPRVRLALISPRSFSVAARAALAKSSPCDAYRMPREELMMSQEPAAVWPLRTACATSAPCAPTPGTRSGMSPTSARTCASSSG